MSTLDGKPLMSFRVVDLKVELEKRGLSKSGAKKDLVARLSKFLVVQSEQQPDSQTEVSSPPNVKLAQDISHSDIVQEYMELRQSQFQSALSEKERQGNLERDEGPGRRLEEEEERQNNKNEEQKILEEHKRQKEESQTHLKMLEEQKEKERKLQEEEECKRQREEPERQRRLQQEQELEKQRFLEDRKRQEEAEREFKILEDQKKKEAELQELERRSKLQQQKLEKQRLLEERKRQEEEDEAGKQLKILQEQKEKERNLQEDDNECKRQKEELERQTKLKQEEDMELEKKNHIKLQEEIKIEDEEPVNRKLEENEKQINGEATENRSAKDSQEGEVREEEEEPKKPQESTGAIHKTEDAECDEIVVSTGSPIDGESDISVPPVPARPPPPPPIELTFRKMSRTIGGGDKTRRQWGTRNKSANSESDAVSGQQLKDVIPDIKPYLEDMNDDDKEGGEEEKVMEIKTTHDDFSTAVVEGCPRDVDGIHELPLPLVQERPSKATFAMSENSQRSSIVSVRNLVRPFTIAQLRELLSRTGKITEDGFWMDKIKSHAIVEYSSAYEAEETVVALDGVKWPSVNPKTLSVLFTTKDVFLQARQGQDVSPPPVKGSETDSRKRRHSKTKDEKNTMDDVVPLQPSKEEQEPLTKRKKNLDDLFRKTKTTPSIYWKPRMEVKNEAD